MKPTFSSLPARTSLSLVLLALGASVPLAACGGNLEGTGGSTTSGATSSTSSSSGDGSGGSGGSGGGAPQARVIVRDHAGRPAVNVDVLVHDPAGVTTQQTKTDKSGAAPVDLASGGGVTALWRSAQDSGEPGYQAVSVVGLAKGAEVRLVADPGNSVSSQEGMNLTFMATAPLQSSEWEVVVSCHEESKVGETSLVYKGCSGTDTYDLVAFLTPRDKRIVFPDQKVQLGANVPFVFDPAKAESAPQVAVDVDKASLPQGTLSLEGRLWANRSEGGRTQLLTQQIVTDPQGTHVLIPRLFVSPGGSFDVELSVNSPVSSVRARLPYGEKDLPTDAVAWKTPVLTPIGEVTSISATVRRPEIPWKLALGGTPSDAVRIQLDYSASDPAPSKGGMHAVRWSLYAASNLTGTASFPAIPEALEGFAPESNALKVTAEHIDVAGTDSLIAAVNAEFDRTGSAWISRIFTPMAP